ncbi:hypothetical protein JOY16_27340, partial [Klebsiella pneumoniae]|uniref:hypothetical protein n=1 Tax=Klebsiella pneumoniae TaxID=573 RepID=UPI00195B55EC
VARGIYHLFLNRFFFFSLLQSGRECFFLLCPLPPGSPPSLSSPSSLLSPLLSLPMFERWLQTEIAAG